MSPRGDDFRRRRGLAPGESEHRLGGGVEPGEEAADGLDEFLAHLRAAAAAQAAVDLRVSLYRRGPIEHKAVAHLRHHRVVAVDYLGIVAEGIESNWNLVEALAAELLERETLSGPATRRVLKDAALRSMDEPVKRFLARIGATPGS